LVPGSLNLRAALELSIKLSDAQEGDEFAFDFENTGRVEPIAMLMVSSEIRRLRSRLPTASIAFLNYTHMGYAAHMGFFRAFGLDFGNVPGAASGNNRYLPLTIFDCGEVTRAAAQRGIEVGDAVEEKSKEMAVLLSGLDSGAVFETLTYSIRELVRNVLEHSCAYRFGVCGQYWSSTNKAEVAILDQGIGLKASLARNPHIEASTDERAINYALMPGVSGKAFKGAKGQQRGPWANSGFGLYMTSRICRNGGTFFIATGDTGMLLTSHVGVKQYLPCRFGGTAIRMVIRTDQVSRLKESLDVYRREGYAIQSKYKEITNIDPSAASLMLSEDFDLSLWDRLLAKIKGRA
jgi:hypothetical protein